MRIYRAEAIEDQIEFLRTRQEALDMEVSKKRAEIAGAKAQLTDLEERIESAEGPLIGIDMRAQKSAIVKDIMILENAIVGMRAQSDALDEEIRDLNSLFLTLPEPRAKAGCDLADAEKKEQSGDV